ncbi:putative holin-like toxin [Paenibacillus popilliae]
MNFSFSDMIMFATFIVALLTYMDRKKEVTHQGWRQKWVTSLL